MTATDHTRSGIVHSLTRPTGDDQITRRLNRTDERVSNVGNRLLVEELTLTEVCERLDVVDQKVDETRKLFRALVIAIPLGVLAWTVLILAGVAWWLA